MKINYKTIKLAAIVALIGIVHKGNAQNLTAGWSTSYYRCVDGTVQSFGNNDSLQLGDNTNVSKSVPVTVSGLTNVKSIAAGYYNAFAIKNDSTVWTWGFNAFGQLGIGSLVKQWIPVQIPSLTGIKQVSGGQAGFHTLALKANGTVLAWGLNAEGQVGDGTTVNKSIPTAIAGLTNVKAIGGGEYHSLALKNDSTVWAWGRNTEGQLGTPASTVIVNTPQQVPGLTKVIAIAGGRYFTVVLKSDSTVWTFGQNNYGQLGVGTNTVEVGLKQVIGLTGVTKIAASAFHGLALKRDSTLRTWGRNSDGQLGIGSTVNSYTIVTVIGANKMVDIKCGTNYSLFMKNNSSLYAAGRNLYGQLGTGTMTAIENLVVSTVSLCAGAITTGLQESVTTSNEFSIYPNPSTGNYFINTNAVNSNTEAIVEIHNLLGENIYSSSLSKLKNNAINISEKPSGIYFVTIISNGKTFTQKLIKE
jgi:alpha-tubulin suppressor-like RCC1 family protein